MDIQISAPNEAKLFADLKKGFQRGLISAADAKQSLENHENENREDLAKSRRDNFLSSIGVIEDPDEAKAINKALERKNTKAVQKAVITASVGSRHLPALDSPEMRAKQQRLHDLHDAILLGRLNPHQRYESPKLTAEYKRLSEECVSKLLVTGSSPVSDFVPTLLSGSLVDLVRYRTPLVANMPHIAHTGGSTMDLPVEGADVFAKYMTEGSDDNTGSHSVNAIPQNDVPTRKVTFTARALKTRTLFSSETTEDSLIPIMPYVRMKLTQAIINSIEDAVINGDRSGTHQDADVDDADDRRKSMEGMRFKALANATSSVDLGGGAASSADVATVAKVMGEYSAMPQDLLLLVSPKTAWDLVTDGNVVTIDKYGPRATILTGQVAVIYGIPVMLSGRMREDLNSSGVTPSPAGTLGAFLIIHRPSAVMADKRAITAESAKDIMTDRFLVVTTWRGEYQDTGSSGASPASSTGFSLAIGRNHTV